MKLYRTLILVMLVCCLLMLQSVMMYSTGEYTVKGCTVSVRDDIYMSPAAELATTKGYPDVVILENSLIRVSSVPNRGRLVFDYVYKPTGHSEFYADTSPMPLETDAGYFLEFGGHYASHPWNPRANQPYDLNYEVVKESFKECTIKIFKKDPESNLRFESFVTIEKDDPSVYVTMLLQNIGDQDERIDFFDRSVLAPGKQMENQTQVILPRGVREVTIGKSDHKWMGDEGEVVPWPQPWQQWGNFKGEGCFWADISSSQERVIKVFDPESKEVFQKEWSSASPYNRIKISSWGPAYEDELGAYPGFAVTNIAEGLVIPAGKSKKFEIKFYTSTL